MNQDFKVALSKRLRKPNQQSSYTPNELEGVCIALSILQVNSSTELGIIECSITQVDLNLLSNSEYRIVIQVQPVVFDNQVIVGLLDQRPFRERDSNLSVMSPWILLIEDGSECIPYVGVIGVLKELPVQVEFIESGIIDGTDTYPTEYQAIQAGEYWVSGKPNRRTYDIQTL